VTEKPIQVKEGFPESCEGSPVCPFCGDTNSDILMVSSDHLPRAATARVGFGCMNGCYWEMRMNSDQRGEPSEVECVVLEVDADLFGEWADEDITFWIRAAKAQAVEQERRK
jgi:hypothetical protein